MASSLRALRAIYLDQIEKLRNERPSQLSICKCRSCGIEILTARSNLGRVDLLCAFGCREIRRQISSRARSLRYNQTLAGRRKKQVLNQRRSRKGVKLAARAAVGSYCRQYYVWLIWQIDGLRISGAALAELVLIILRKVRSQGLGKPTEICDIPDS